MLAYHFTSDTLRDGRPVPPIGEMLVHSSEVTLCCEGLHASTPFADVLKYAPENSLYRVKLEWGA